MITAEYVYNKAIAQSELNHRLDKSPGAMMLPIAYVALAMISAYMAYLFWAKWVLDYSMAIKFFPVFGIWLTALAIIRHHGGSHLRRQMEWMLEDADGKKVRFDFDEKGLRRTVPGQIGAFYPWVDVADLMPVEGGMFLDLRIVARAYWLPDTAFGTSQARDGFVRLAKSHAVHVSDAWSRRSQEPSGA
jgi:hypothetical protein